MSNFAEVLNALNLSSANKTNAQVFEASSLYIPTNRTYGGQYLAQSLVAAALTTSEYRTPNSIHAYFMKAGLLNEPLHYEVERLRDGAKFSHREVTCFQKSQGERPVFKALVSFHEQENSAVDFSTPPQIQVPPPKDVPLIGDAFKEHVATNKWARYFAKEMPFELRPISPSLFLGADPKGKQALELAWVRIRPDDAKFLGGEVSPLAAAATKSFGASSATPHLEVPAQCLQRSLLAFLSDQFAFSPALRRGGVSWLSKDAHFVSLDHAQYFHRDIDLTKWHLIVGNSPTAGNARGVGITHVMNESGEVVSTFTQEGLIRCSD